MKNYIVVVKTVVAMIMLMPLISCLWRKPVEVIISEKKLKLTSVPLIIECPSPFYRTRKSASLDIFPSLKWSLAWENKRGGIKLENGQEIFINVILLDAQENEYTTKCYGKAGNSLAANFDHIPQNVRIVRIKLLASEIISCDKIRWTCYDPI